MTYIAYEEGEGTTINDVKFLKKLFNENRNRFVEEYTNEMYLAYLEFKMDFLTRNKAHYEFATEKEMKTLYRQRAEQFLDDLVFLTKNE